MHIQPYLFFDGRCEEAIEFYQQAVGAKVEMLMRFKDSPEPPQPGCTAPGSENKVMHACIKIGDTAVMASDGRCEGKPSFQGFYAVADGKNRGRRRPLLRGARCGRTGADAAGQNFLFAALRHGRRPLRRVVDGHHNAVTALSPPNPRKQP